MRQRILETYNHARQTLKMGSEHASEFAFNSNGSLLQYVPREQPTELQFAHFSLAPSNIHVTTLVEGKAAVAMFYSQGDVQFAGGPMVRGYRTRVSQTWVNDEGGWMMKTAHYSPMAGGEGVVSIPSGSMSESKSSRAPVVHSARAALALSLIHI